MKLKKFLAAILLPLLLPVACEENEQVKDPDPV